MVYERTMGAYERNSLLSGQSKCILKHLQSVLNSAVRLIHLTSRYEHVTPLLIQLHWLPIEQRITFKIAVITHLNLILKLMVADLLLLPHLLCLECSSIRT